MAKATQEDSFTFVGGLSTEGGFFITPPNSWKEGDNVTPSTDGTVRRRKALDYEANYQAEDSGMYTADVNSAAYTVEVWESVAGNGNLEFFVVQQGSMVWFYKAASGTVSASKKAFSIDLTPYQCFGNQNVVGSNVISVASCYGKLLITSIDTEPLLVTYNEDDTITVKKLELKIRDFTGIRSPADPQAEKTEEEWTALTPTFWPHALYNLYNQGWNDTQIYEYKAANTNKLPANTKQWIYGKNTTDDFDVTVLAKQDFGTSLAPKGRFVLQAFYQDRATVISTLENTTPQTPSVPATPNVNDFYDYGQQQE